MTINDLDYAQPLREKFLKEAKDFNLGEWACSDSGNDETCSSYNKEKDIQIFYPNADIHNEQEEEYSTYSLNIRDGEKYMEFETLEQVIRFLISIKNQ